MLINEQHFQVLKSTLNEQTGWPAGSPSAWYEWVRHNSNVKLSPTSLPEKADRQILKKMVSNPNIDTTSCCISILAWGGMNRKHGVLLMNSCGNGWLKVAEEIRSGKYSRLEAYDFYAKLRMKDNLQGMGPAYFTKLIFFLMPQSDSRGFIMDQWTSASVNLLSPVRLVEMRKSFFQLKNSRRMFETVSDKNTSKNYEGYCQYIEQLAMPNRLNVNEERVEEMLFSQGRGKGTWRNYLVSNRQSA